MLAFATIVLYCMYIQWYMIYMYMNTHWPDQPTDLFNNKSMLILWSNDNQEKCDTGCVLAPGDTITHG